MKKLLFFIACTFSATIIFGQQYYEVTAYFTSGVIRTVTTTDTFATVTAADIQAVLTKYSIPGSNVYPAFPEFNELDTLLLPNAKTGQTDSIKQMDRAKIFTITVSDTITANNLITGLGSLSEVLFVEANGSDSSLTVPVDYQYQNGNQWYLNNPSYPSADIRALSAWNIFTGNPNSIIAIIDDGVDIKHFDLSAKIIGGDKTFSINKSGFSHGTGVASVSAATTNNNSNSYPNSSVAGVDWQAKILPEDKTDYFSSGFDIGYYTRRPHGWNLIVKKVLAGVNFSANVWTLNHSYYLNTTFGNNTKSVALNEAMVYAYKNNRVSCVAAGNTNSSRTDLYPANYATGIIQVGSSNESATRLSGTGGSTYGPNLDVVAPGQLIPCLNYNNNVSIQSGTSMASPVVAGIASLLKGYNTSLYNDDIESIIKLSADDILPAGRDDQTGYGKVNAYTALTYLKSPYQLQHLTTTGGTVYISSNYIVGIIGGLRIADGIYHMQKIEVRTTVNLPSNYCSLIGVWGTGVKTTGWHDDGFCYGDGFCEVVPGSQTATQVTLRTYVYQLYINGLLSNAYFPRSPQNVTFAYSLLDIPAPSVTISGSFPTCGTSGTFTANGVPQGTTVTWSLNPSGIVNPGCTYCNQTTVTKMANGNTTLSVSVPNGCGTSPYVINTPIVVGAPTVNASGAPYGSCYGSTQTWSLTASPASGSNWNWQAFPANGSSIYIRNGYTPTAYADVTGGGTISLSYTDVCGVVQNIGGPTVYSTCQGPHIVEIIPNPAKSQITISTQPQAGVGAENKLQTNGSNLPSLMYAVKITDRFGVIRKSLSYKEGVSSKTLTVADLNVGTYIVSIFDGKYWSSQKLLIQK